MSTDDERFLKAAKEVLVKFIEMGSVSPSNFEDKFRSIYLTIKNTVLSARLPDLETYSAPEEKPPGK